MRWMLLIAALFAGGAAAGAPLDLLPNQGFEDAHLGWSLWPPESQSRLEVDTAVVRSGRQSLRVTAARGSDGAFAVTTSRTFEYDVVYRVSVAIRKDPGVPDSAISYAINYRGGPDNAIQQRARPTRLRRTPEGKWVRWSGLFLTPKEIGEWQFLLGVEHTVGRVWFDDIRIERLGPASELNPDVWTNLTIGVEIGSKPQQRFAKHKEADDTVYRMSKRYNDLLFRSAFAEDGGRYLFLLNPDLDAPAEERVQVARPANWAVDVSVAGGYPVPLKRTGEGVSFAVRLGPGESTALWLE